MLLIKPGSSSEFQLLSGATSCSDDLNWLIKINQITRKKTETSKKTKREKPVEKGLRDNQDNNDKNGNKYFIVQP
jgi:hypothetical protein